MNSLKTHKTQSINIKGKLFTFDRPLVMGILNITPDSFYDGGQHNNVEQAMAKANELLINGADIIDIGAYSSRPGAPLISVQEELNRAIPVIEKLHKAYPDAILSIDTFRAEVAEAAITAGAHIINDVSGGTIDPNMFATVAQLQVPYILMHMRGIPENMQELTTYDDIVEDVATFFGRKSKPATCLRCKRYYLRSRLWFCEKSRSKL